MDPYKLELLKKSYQILAERDSEFKKEWKELEKYNLEDFSNSEELKMRVAIFATKYDKILADIIRGL